MAIHPAGAQIAGGSDDGQKRVTESPASAKQLPRGYPAPTWSGNVRGGSLARGPRAAAAPKAKFRAPTRAGKISTGSALKGRKSPAAPKRCLRVLKRHDLNNARATKTQSGRSLTSRLNHARPRNAHVPGRLGTTTGLPSHGRPRNVRRSFAASLVVFLCGVPSLAPRLRRASGEAGRGTLVPSRHVGRFTGLRGRVSLVAPVLVELWCSAKRPQ